MTEQLPGAPAVTVAVTRAKFVPALLLDTLTLGTLLVAVGHTVALGGPTTLVTPVGHAAGHTSAQSKQLHMLMGKDRCYLNFSPIST